MRQFCSALEFLPKKVHIRFGILQYLVMNEGEQQKATGQGPTPFRPVKVNHVRLPSFKVIHADGAWATANADGIIHLNFFSEQPPIPAWVVAHVNADGAYKGEYQLPLESEPQYFSVSHDITHAVALSIPAAERLRDTLISYIQIARQQAEYSATQARK